MSTDKDFNSTSQASQNSPGAYDLDGSGIRVYGPTEAEARIINREFLELDDPYAGTPTENIPDDYWKNGQVPPLVLDNEPEGVFTFVGGTLYFDRCEECNGIVWENEQCRHCEFPPYPGYIPFEGEPFPYTRESDREWLSGGIEW